MFSPSQLALLPLSQELGDLVFQWRNSPYVRNMMFYNQPIAPEEHKNWLARVLHDESVRYRVLLLDIAPVGLVNFTQINPERERCHWGFYLGERDVPRGTGR